MMPSRLGPRKPGHSAAVSVAAAEESAIGSSTVNSNKKQVQDYVKRSPQLEKFLLDRKQEELLKEVQELHKTLEGFSFSYVTDKPLGDGHAILQAKKLVGQEPCFVLYPDDIIEGNTPGCTQIAQVFKTSQKPIKNKSCYRINSN